MRLRDYQHEAVQSVYAHLREKSTNPCVVIPTAGGKTPILATIARDAVKHWGARVLILAHVKELLLQAVEKLISVEPDLEDEIGIYSAGIGRRDVDHPLIVAGIHSAYRNAEGFGPINLIIVDEAHMIPPGGEGMYRSLLSDAESINPRMRVVGLTATPYRMGSGIICGKENILHEVCYEVGVKELIHNGYLCPLHSKAAKQKVDTDSLHIKGGEFVASEVESMMDDDSLVRSACREIVEHTAERHSVLIFAAGVQHALHVHRVLGEIGHECGFVCGDTLPFERAETLKRFKDGELKYLVNVNVLTTGFDAPNIDCVALLRPTLSPGMYYQMVGRGFRLFPGKSDCLVLDFGGNIERHGPVDMIQPKIRNGANTGSGNPPGKECPECNTVVHISCMVCPHCEHVWQEKEKSKHNEHATSAGVISGQTIEREWELESQGSVLRGVEYYIHTKKDGSGPRTLRIDYRDVDGNEVSEWVCPEHSGFAFHKFKDWWRARSNEDIPESTQEAFELSHTLAIPTHITVRETAGEKFARVTDYRFGEMLLNPIDQRPADILYPLANGEEIPF